MCMARLIVCLAIFYALAALGGPSEPDRNTIHIAPGDYAWHPEVSPSGPLVVIVSLDEQRVYVYRNGIAIGFAAISSGRRGHETPPGIYTILEKDRDHHSTLYDNAPMPFMERLTWDGVALHGGRLPGYPASHGCVRLPKAFAELLFAITQPGETVVIANSSVSPTDVVHPAALAPVGTLGEPLASSAAPEISFTWNDNAAAEGPVSVLVSIHDRMAYVLRNGVRIGSAAIDVEDGFSLGGTLLFVTREGYDADEPSRLDPSQPRHRWSSFPVDMTGAVPSPDDVASHIRVPDVFARALYPILTPGTTVVVTDFPAVRSTSTSLQAVLESGPR